MRTTSFARSRGPRCRAPHCGIPTTRQVQNIKKVPTFAFVFLLPKPCTSSHFCHSDCLSGTMLTLRSLGTRSTSTKCILSRVKHARLHVSHRPQRADVSEQPVFPENSHEDQVSKPPESYIHSLAGPFSQSVPTYDLELPKMLLRDMCTCPQCVDPSTRQKLFSTAEIPPDISVEEVVRYKGGLQVTWLVDLPGIKRPHTSFYPQEVLDAIKRTGSSKILPRLPRRRYWTDSQFRAETADITYEAYMQDENVFFKALQQLHSHGLLFLKDVPEDPESVSRITQRIGPLKNTFYGDTWDVRSVPQAKNVAYTSQDLGFHMDLMYLKQPPHLQFLHCIRSSANGGASLFADSFKAVRHLWKHDRESFTDLERIPITFHYDHIDSHYYQQSRPLIELAPLNFDGKVFPNYRGLQLFAQDQARGGWVKKLFNLDDYLEAVTWSPQFQAPFQLTNPHTQFFDRDLSERNEYAIRRWRTAAGRFNSHIHRPENIYERMMKPGECVIFDNRRVLHARKAFEVADAGKERWLRGAYLDKDPFISKLITLGHKRESRFEEISSSAG